VSMFSKIRDTLSKTRQNLASKVSQIFSGKNQVDDALLEELEEALILADVGPKTAALLVEAVRKAPRTGSTGSGLFEILQGSISQILSLARGEMVTCDARPYCVMVVGVNGVGKTTTIAKLAKLYKDSGETVLLAAADTFRAAAIDQLEVWAERVGCDLVKHKEGSDPAAVVFDAISAAKARGRSVVIVDTAGRLHTKVNLMNELKKVSRVMEREVPGAPHETLLVLDANTGQNALQQARMFKEVTDVTGIVITKLDGTAKGGIVITIASELGLPVKFITTGETIDDIQPFDPEEFARAMFR
jgi:fused signal recognition particle receptor